MKEDKNKCERRRKTKRGEGEDEGRADDGIGDNRGKGQKAGGLEWK